jgi:hypothetical protein
MYIFAVYIQQYNVMMIIQLDILLKYSNLLRIISKWYGLIKCEILPPKGLYHPVLPVKNKTKSGGAKLAFPLCQVCAKLNNQKDISGVQMKSWAGKWEGVGNRQLLCFLKRRLIGTC